MKPVPNPLQPAGRPLWMPALALICLGALLGFTGCKIVKTTASVPGRTVSVFFPGGKSEQPDPADLQQSLMRYSDAFATRTVESVDELVDVPGSPLTQETALRFKISTVGGMISIATGDNPYGNLLDMVSVTVLTRMVLENYWVPTTNGAIFEPWLRRMQGLETDVWSIADQILSVEQQDELRKTIQTHYTTLTGFSNLFVVHPQDLLVPRVLAKKKNTQLSVFNLAALDPLAGLDPAVREITETRLFAARAMYTIQRMPWLVRWQSQLMVLETTDQPKVAQALNDATSLGTSIDRVSQAAETISQTAAALPAQIAAERQAIVAALDAQEGKITTVLQSGTEFSTSLNTTIGTFDALMKRFGVGEPDTNPPPAGPQGPPFNILDYAQTAEQITGMAKALNVAIAELNTTLDSPALDRLSHQATADAHSVLNHAFLLAAGLVVLILVC
ncbi:MAG: hypothetical protein MUC91_12355, partial [Verrucomicrobia bacterium]|nr:hypothetical protein [Verrucomicrobiota bacterium]